MADNLVTCPYCNCPVSSRRLRMHTNERCPKSPRVIRSKLQADTRMAARARNAFKKTVLVRSRLDRLYRDLTSVSAAPDDHELAKVFVAFYTMYVWQREDSIAVPRDSSIDAFGERSTSIRAVSGGLPSLGKRAK